MKKWDFFIIGAVLLLAIGFGGITTLMKWSSTSGSTEERYVQLRVNGDVVEELPLSEEHREAFGSEYGGNRFLIKDGTVEMLEADCPDQYCVKHRKISEVGETIVCLPNRLVIEICAGEANAGNHQASDSTSPEIDAVAE